MAADLSTSPPTTDRTRSVGRVVQSFGALAASNLVSQLIGFAVLVYVARRTGATNLGAYAFAFLFATYFNLFAAWASTIWLCAMSLRTDSLSAP